MYEEGEGESDGMFVYSKASRIEAVSLHNWTGYFYTMLTSWAAC